MTFATYEESRTQGEPISLYHFQYGESSTQFYAYTDGEQAVTYAGKIYLPIPIAMGAVRASGTLDKQSIEVRTPQNVELAELFRLYPPSQVVTLVVRQGHVGDADAQFLVTWTGRVIGHKRQGNEAVYTIESLATAMRRSILRRHYMLGCGHALYGPSCKANKAAATVIRSVLSVSGASVTLLDLWQTEERKPKYIGGMVEWEALDGTKESRWLVRLSGTNNQTLMLDGVAKGLVSGMSVNVILGCNHQAGLEDDCIVLHENINNFGGCPWIPTQNPIGIKNTFY